MRNDFNTTTTRGHAFFVYGDDNERLNIITEYFRQGLENNELCIFVTPEAPKEVVKNFGKKDLDLRGAVDEGAFRIFEMNSTYLPNGQFVAEYMLSNIRIFLEESKLQGFSGLRTAGEMAWLIEHPELHQEATLYEKEVNDVAKPDANFVGLCLYPLEEQHEEIINQAAETHPSFILDGQAHRNLAFAFA